MLLLAFVESVADRAGRERDGVFIARSDEEEEEEEGCVPKRKWRRSEAAGEREEYGWCETLGKG